MSEDNGQPSEQQPQFNPQSGYPVGQQPPTPPYPPQGAANPYAGYTGVPGQPPYQPGMQPYPVYVLPDHPRATPALVVGLVAVAGTFTCGLPILASPVAWVLGAQARKEIRNAPQQWGGESKATAGMVLGIIGTVLLVIAIVLITLVIVVAVNDPGAFDSDTGV